MTTLALALAVTITAAPQEPECDLEKLASMDDGALLRYQKDLGVKMFQGYLAFSDGEVSECDHWTAMATLMGEKLRLDTEAFTRPGIIGSATPAERRMVEEGRPDDEETYRTWTARAKQVCTEPAPARADAEDRRALPEPECDLEELDSMDLDALLEKQTENQGRLDGVQVVAGLASLLEQEVVRGCDYWIALATLFRDMRCINFELLSRPEFGDRVDAIAEMGLAWRSVIEENNRNYDPSYRRAMERVKEVCEEPAR